MISYKLLKYQAVMLYCVTLSQYAEEPIATLAPCYNIGVVINKYTALHIEFMKS